MERSWREGNAALKMSPANDVLVRPKKPQVCTLRATTTDAEAAVFGLVATTDAAALLLAQLEEQVRSVGMPKKLTPELVRFAIERHKSVSAAARFLGIARSTLRVTWTRMQREEV